MSFYRNTFFLVKGLSEFTKGGFEKAKRSFNPTALDVDCAGKIALITGANSGLGKQAAMEIARRGGTVFLLCRSRERGEEARKEIVEETKNEKVFLKLIDLSSLNSIDSFVKEFKAENDKVDILINNGGVMINERKETSEGIEMNFATNTLGTFFLTNSLIDLLEKGAPSRVITVSSGGMYTEKLDISDLEQKKKTFDGTFAYAQNKRQQVVLTELWAQKYSDKKIFFYSCHPGWTDTPAVRESMPNFYENLKDKLRTTPEGADTMVWLAISPEVTSKVKPGDFVFDRKSVEKHFPLAWTHHDEKDNNTLWLSLLSYVNKIIPPPPSSSSSSPSPSSSPSSPPSSSSSSPSSPPPSSSPPSS